MKKHGKKVLAGWTAVLLVLVAAGAAVWFLWLGPVQKTPVDTVLYEEDGALYCALPASGNRVRLAERAAGVQTAFADEGGLVYTAENGVLTVRNLRNGAEENEPAVQLDNGVEELYGVCGRNLLLYRTQAGALCLHDGQTRVELGQNIKKVLLSPGRDAALYQDEAGMVYCISLSMSAVAQPLSTVDDFSGSITSAQQFGTIWFVQDGQAYVQQPGGEKRPVQLPAGQAEDVFAVAGTVYLVGSETSSVPAGQLVTDDMAVADAALKEPAYPEEKEEDKPKYPSIRDYWDSDFNLDTDRYYADVEAYEKKLSQYEAERKRLLEEYEKDRAAWSRKLARDALRAELKEKQIPWTVKSLYCLDGDTAVLISKNYLDCYNFSANRNTADVLDAKSPALLYSVFSDERTEKLQLSEILSISTVQDQIMAKTTIGAFRLAVGKDSFEVHSTQKGGGFEGIYLSVKEKILYYRLDGGLYRLCFTSSGGTPEKLADSVKEYSVGTDEMQCFYTVEDVSGYSLFCDGEKLLEGVSPDSIHFTADGKTLLCLKDVNERSGLGVLYSISEESAPVLISDRVAAAAGRDGAFISYLYDYSPTAGYGELRLYTGGENAPASFSVRASRLVY